MGRRSRSKKVRSQLEVNQPVQRCERMCLGKTIFWSEFQAVMKAKEITLEGHPMRSYNCPNCLQWHLASIGESKPRKRRPEPIKAEENGEQLQPQHAN